MSLRDRLFNVAKAELKDAARKIREGIFGDGRDEGYVFEHHSDSSRDDDELPDLPSPDRDTPDIRRYYANLELPIGATLPEVKAAYRRLMRRYHPDRHQHDPDRARAANELAQRLREAYEGLSVHLAKER